VDRRSLKFTSTEWPQLTLQSIAAAAGLAIVEVVHAGWPLGLLSDADGNGWAVSAGDRNEVAVIHLIRCALADLRAELVRLFGTWVDLRYEGDDVLPGLHLARIATITLPMLAWPVVVDVARAVPILASTPVGAATPADSGMVLRRLDRGGALLRSDP